MRLTRTPVLESVRKADFLVSTIFIVDTIFRGPYQSIKTVLAGRLRWI